MALRIGRDSARLVACIATVDTLGFEMPVAEKGGGVYSALRTPCV
jgi:hypothetical protein